MKLDGREKRAVNELSEAVNFAIEESNLVADAIEHLRNIGYEPNLNLKLEIGLQEILGSSEALAEEISLELTEEDLRTLQRMKIKIDD